MWYALLAIFFSILWTILIIRGIIFFIDPLIISPSYKGKKSNHFNGKHFYNIGWTPEQSRKLEGTGNNKLGFRSFTRWLFDKHKKIWDKRTVPTIIPKLSHDEDSFHITYINHATVLIQIAEFNILTDPVWSYRVSPFSWLGPRRFVNPGVNIEDIPPIDCVLLSHNHYDHLDISTLKQLYEKHRMPIYTGLGNKRFLRKHKIISGIDMDWGETYTLEKHSTTAVITYLPAQHFSARGLSDRNKTLWGGFGIRIGEKTLYFAWDTWYGTEFLAKIREYFPLGFDVGLLPMGAYVPRWFMGSIHTTPEESLQIQKDLNIKTGIGIHWGTFSLALDGQDEPLDDLVEAIQKPEYQNIDFRIGPNGSEWTL